MLCRESLTIEIRYMVQGLGKLSRQARDKVCLSHTESSGFSSTYEIIFL